MTLLEILVQSSMFFIIAASAAALLVLGSYILNKEENVIWNVIAGCFQRLKRYSDHLGDSLTSLILGKVKQK